MSWVSFLIKDHFLFNRFDFYLTNSNAFRDEKNCGNIPSNGMRQMVANANTNANTNSNTASSHTPFQLQLKADAHTQQQSQKPQQQQSVHVSHNNIVASHQPFDNNHRWTLK